MTSVHSLCRCLTSNVRTSCSVLLADVPGFQSIAASQHASTFEDLCHNYLNERVHMLLHDATFTAPLDLYAQVRLDDGQTSVRC